MKNIRDRINITRNIVHNNIRCLAAAVSAVVLDRVVIIFFILWVFIFFTTKKPANSVNREKIKNIYYIFIRFTKI